MTQELFSPGQAVVPKNPNEMAIQDLGSGPFKILTVEEVPDKCNCGAPMTDADRWPHLCPYERMGYGKPLREGAGLQWVTIDDGTGKPLTRTFPDGEHVRKYSGMYFKAA